MSTIWASLDDALLVPASRGVHNLDYLTGFLTRFPFFWRLPVGFGADSDSCQKG